VGPKRTGSYHHGDLRRALVAAALEVIDQRGSPDFSLRALAQQLNVSHASAYRHFGSKDELLRAVAGEGLEQLAQEIRRAGEGVGELGEVIRRCGLAYVRFGQRNPGLYQLIFSSVVQEHEESRAAADQVLDISAELVGAAQQAGLVRAGDPQDHARAAWALLHGMVDLELRGQFWRRTEEEVLEHAEGLLDVFLHGLFLREDADA